jgi:hypothetical protein
MESSGKAELAQHLALERGSKGREGCPQMAQALTALDRGSMA